MDKLTEELFTTIMRRQDDQEDRIKKLEAAGYKKKPFWKQNPDKPATDKQIYAVHQAGGEIWEGMTQGDIDGQFKIINERKNNQQESQKRSNLDTGERIQPAELVPRKPLTKEEIAEIGEENLL